MKCQMTVFYPYQEDLMDNLTLFEPLFYCHVFGSSVFFFDSFNSPLLPLNSYYGITTSPYLNLYFLKGSPLLKALAWFKQVTINKEILQDSSALIYRSLPETLFLSTIK